MEIRFITTRDLENSSGQKKGRVRVIVLKGEDIANIDFTCPECNYNQKKKEEFKMPLMLKCEKCGFEIELRSLREEIKKKKF
ncbi:MAG: hypothetical protein QW451_00145 [Candidatus Aenigmatarchaeota archaeon]